MKKRMVNINWLIAGMLALLSGLAQAQSEPYQAGLHYVELQNAPINNEKMVLVEAFSYLCTHCNTFEPYIGAWKKRKPENVAFTRIPIIFGRSAWEIYARGYVTAEMMGIGEEAHSAMMNRIWNEKAVMRTMDEIAEFYSGFGVTADAFTATSKSFAVDAKMRKDQRLAQDWGIQGTPSLVLNARYRIEGNAAVPSYDVMLDVVDFLIAKDTAASLERAAQKAAKEATAVADEVAAEPVAAAEDS